MKILIVALLFALTIPVIAETGRTRPVDDEYEGLCLHGITMLVLVKNLDKQSETGQLSGAEYQKFLGILKDSFLEAEIIFRCRVQTGMEK